METSQGVKPATATYWQKAVRDEENNGMQFPVRSKASNPWCYDLDAASFSIVCMIAFGLKLECNVFLVQYVQCIMSV